MTNLNQLKTQADKALQAIKDKTVSALTVSRQDGPVNVFAFSCLQAQIKNDISQLAFIGSIIAKGASHNALKQYPSRSKTLAVMPVIAFTIGKGEKAQNISFTQEEILAADKPLFSVATAYRMIRAATEKTEISDDDIVKMQLETANTVSGKEITVSELSTTEYNEYLAQGKTRLAQEADEEILKNIPSLEKEVQQKLEFLKSKSPETFDSLMEKFFPKTAIVSSETNKQVNASH